MCAGPMMADRAGEPRSDEAVQAHDCPVCRGAMTPGQRRVPIIVEAHSSCVVVADIDTSTTRCMGRGCDRTAEAIVRGLVEGQGITEHPVYLCIDHLRGGEYAVDIFRWLTDGRVSANG